MFGDESWRCAARAVCCFGAVYPPSSLPSSTKFWRCTLLFTGSTPRSALNALLSPLVTTPFRFRLPPAPSYHHRLTLFLLIIPQTLLRDTPFPQLKDTLVKYQNPAEADSMMRVQQELDETKIVLVGA